MTQAVPDTDLIEKLNDPRYFVETFCWIIDKNRVKVPFILNPAQAKYYENRSQFDLILKARKQGFSSLIEAIWLHACLFQDNVRAVVLSHEMEATKRHFDRIRYYLETMGNGDDLKFVVDLDEDSQKQLKFPQNNSSFWIGTAGSRAFGRGDDITHLHLSEVAHYQNQDVLTSALEACVPNAYRVMETTANGVGEAFHRLWQEAKDEQSGSPWEAHFFSWFEDPTNKAALPTGVNIRFTDQEKRMEKAYKLSDEQIYWYRTKRASLADKSLMPQEYPCTDSEAFLSSGRHVFDMQKLDQMKERAKNNPALYVGEFLDDGRQVKFVDNQEGTVKIWKMPRPERQYLISADCSEGVPGGDFSVAQILDRSSWEVVATIRLRVNPGEWGGMLVEAARFYNNAVIVPENNNHGWAAIEAIKNKKYPHLLNTKELWPEAETPKDGFPTTEKNRLLAINALRNAINDDTILINDLVTISELETFVQNEKTGKFEAQKGCFDDCVMSLAIGTYCLGFLTVDETYAAHLQKDRHRGSMLSTVINSARKRRYSHVSV